MQQATTAQSSLLHSIRMALTAVCLLTMSTWHWLSNEAENEREDQDQLTFPADHFVLSP